MCIFFIYHNSFLKSGIYICTYEHIILAAFIDVAPLLKRMALRITNILICIYYALYHLKKKKMKSNQKAMKYQQAIGRNTGKENKTNIGISYISKAHGLF